jgi:2-polyprenyl-6-methoxyphenol hydroxylase-like FAD-dependent oxidoreductase
VTARSAIVVGAGIGGLATACALSRTGWAVTVYEKASVLKEVGAGLSMAPNAVRAMDWLGLGERMRPEAQGQGIGVRTRSGRWLVRLEGTDLAGRFGNAMYAMHRADLHRMLFDTACQSCTIHTGHRAMSLDPGQGTVVLQGRDGPVRVSGDLVVVADGVHSGLRSMLYPDHPGAAYAGYVCWRGIAPAVFGGRLATPPVWTDSWGRGVRFGSAPLADGKVFWYGSAAGAQGAFADDSLDDVARRFRGWHAPIAELIAASKPSALLRNDIYFVREPVPAFTVGNTVLLGDAAHAVTPDIGQGACLAIEDAVVLAATTAAHDDLAAGLAEYDRVRRPRTQQLARLSGRSAQVQQASHRVSAALRDLAVFLMPRGAYLSAADEALGWRPPEPAGQRPL